MKKSAAFVFALLVAAGAQATCFTVLGPGGQILSRTSTPPVDMSRQLHETVPQRFGTGAVMVFGSTQDETTCGPEAVRDDQPQQAPAARAKKVGHPMNGKARAARRKKT
jgi:predicted small secreted protein